MKVFKNRRSSYSSPLYFLLFILARTAANPELQRDLDRGRPVEFFQEIVASDLRFLFNQHPGLAKMLYYWSSLQANSNYFISFDYFLRIADQLDVQGGVSKHFSNLEGGIGNEFEILRNYLHLDALPTAHAKYLHGTQFVLFNHDLLAEVGLAKVNRAVRGLEAFDDKARKDILEAILLNDGDDYSASSLLSSLLRDRHELFEHHSEWMRYIHHLVDHGNPWHSHLNRITYLNLEPQAFHDLMTRLAENNSYPRFLWAHYFKTFPDRAIPFLGRENFYKHHGEIVCTAINKVPDDDLREKSCKTVLEQERFYGQHAAMVITALTNLKDRMLLKSKCKEVVAATDVNVDIHPQVVKVARAKLRKLDD